MSVGLSKDLELQTRIAKEGPVSIESTATRRAFRIYLPNKIEVTGFEGRKIMIEVGKQAPDFELASHLGGTKFTLYQFKGHKNVMLVFYPLDWTPT